MGHNLLWAAQSSPVWIREHLQPARLPPGGPTGLTPVLSHPAAPHTAPPRKGSLALNAWFLDDGTQVGKLEDLNQVIDILVHEGPAHGLILSTSLTVVPPSTPKSTIWCWKRTRITSWPKQTSINLARDAARDVRGDLAWGPNADSLTALAAVCENVRKH